MPEQTPLLALFLLLTLPQLTLVHPYLHLLLIAPLLLYVGCQRNLAQANQDPSKSQVETVTKKDAMQFPIFGSAMLLALYILVKIVSKKYIDLLISLYFVVLGAMGLFGAFQPALVQALNAQHLHKHQIAFQYKFWKRDKNQDDKFTAEFTNLDCVFFGICTSFSVWYAVTKEWYLNNLLGSAFAIQGIEMLALSSYAVGCILLCGLFVYDIFWVFGTEVMVEVAKGINAPIKILFPKVLGVKPVPCSMLGLGDIVIPGIFVALMLRFDVKMGISSQPYFFTNFIAYVMGLMATIYVMHRFDSAQPALLYLVPACIGASLLTAVWRGELRALLMHNEEEKKVEGKED